MPTLNTTVVLLLIIYLHPNVVVRVGWEPSAANDSFMVRKRKNKSSKNQQAPITFSEATTHVSRHQSRVRESAGFGNEEGLMLKTSTPWS